MEFKLLGQLRVDTGQGPVTIGAPKQRVVLAALLLQPNRVVGTDRLIDLVWQGRPPATARTALQNHVMRLRAALGSAGERIRTAGPGYLVEVHPDELDVERFLTLGERGGQAAAAGRWAEARELLARSLEQWRDQPLLDVPSDELCAEAGDRLAECRARILADRIDAELALGHHRAVLTELRAAVADRPLDERPHGQLMLALYRCGRQAEALAGYRGLRALLVAELGIEPGPEVTELHQRILDADPGLLLPSTAVDEPPSAPEAPGSRPDAPPAARPDGRLRSAAVALACLLIGCLAGRHLAPHRAAAATPHAGYVARTGSEQLTAGTGTTTGTELPVRAPVTAGDTLVVSLMLDATTPGAVSVTDTGGDSFIPVADVTDGAGNRTLLLAAFGARPLGTADRISAVYPPASRHHIAVDEFRGVSAVAGQAVAAAPPGQSPSAFSTGATPLDCAPGDLLVASVGSDTAPDFAAGWQPLPVPEASSSSLTTAYRVATGPGRCAVTGRTRAPWEAALVVFH